MVLKLSIRREKRRKKALSDTYLLKLHEEKIKRVEVFAVLFEGVVQVGAGDFTGGAYFTDAGVFLNFLAFFDDDLAEVAVEGFKTVFVADLYEVAQVWLEAGFCYHAVSAGHHVLAGAAFQIYAPVKFKDFMNGVLAGAVEGVYLYFPFQRVTGGNVADEEVFKRIIMDIAHHFCQVSHGGKFFFPIILHVIFITILGAQRMDTANQNC